MPRRRDMRKYQAEIMEAVSTGNMRVLQGLAKELRDARKAKEILLKKCCNVQHINGDHSLLEIVRRLPHIEGHYKHFPEGRHSHGN